LKAEPFVFDLRGDVADGGLELELELEFMGHYGEPTLQLVHGVQERDTGVAAVYLLEYNPYNGEWSTSRQVGIPGVVVS
jgi:mono-ADP-ribosyltransferase sirtuin 6